MKRKGVILCYLLLITILSVKGSRISVSSFPLMDELPSNTIQRMFQDSDGFLWLGTTDGLCRYDAHRLLVFRSDVNNPNLLTNNEITCIAEDKNNHLLIGTKSGLNVLNKRTYQISAFSDSLMHNKEIKSMIITQDGYIWVGTTNSAFCYNPDFTLRKNYSDLLPVTSVNSFFEDEDGQLWLLLWKNGLFKYNAANDSFTRMPPIGKNDNPFYLFKDKRNHYWLCSWDDGMYLFHPDKKTDACYEPIHIMNKDKHSPEKIFYSIAEDDVNGYLWLMSNFGLHAFGYTSDGTTLQEVDVSDLFEQHNNIYSEMIKGKDGNIWIATFNEGLLSIDFKKPQIENYTLPSIKEQTGFAANVSSLFKDEDGEIWFCQNRWGLALYNIKEDKVRLYEHIPILKNQKDLDAVYTIYGFRSMPGTIWVSIENQDIIYEIKKEKSEIISSVPFHLADYQSNAGIPFLFYEDRKNNIWIATTTGLFVKPYLKTGIERINYSFGAITGIAEDIKGNIWVSDKSSGVFMLPASPATIISEIGIVHFSKESGHLTSNHIEAICADMNGKVWIGTKEGSLLVYDMVEKNFRNETKALIFLTEGIHTLTSDIYGNIWILTDKKVIEYNPYNGASRNYTTADGVQVSSFKEKSFYKDEKSGKLYFGGNKGISVFTPTESLTQHPHDTKTLVSDIRINNQSVFRLNKNDRFDITSQTLHLKPDDKNIEIDFTSFNYSFPANVRYAYRMEGVDEDWLYTSANRQYAFYNKLKKGACKFYIKATDENNTWSSVTSTLFIYKHPAFYETGWAYAFYFICLFMTVYLFWRWINNRIKLKHELKIVQIEKEKSEELTQTKLRYFTNITHDFLTPLTILSYLIDDAEITHKNMSMFGVMRSNIDKLMRLLQQILDFRKIDNGKMKLVLSCTDIVKFVKDLCYTNFSPLIKRKNIYFTFTASPNRITAYFDADIIDKVMYNLLSNAIKYTPNDGMVEVEMEEIKEDYTWIIIKVKDSGVGIDPENIPHIFTRFYSSYKNTAIKTNGIGLSLTKELIDIHKGDISVQSELNKGTVFTVKIPIDKDAYQESEIKNLKQLIVEDKTVGASPVFELSDANEKNANDNLKKDNQTTLLIVEDNEELLILIRNLMSHHYQVLTAKNGREALAVVQKNNIQIIISDVMMPEMDGLELCRTIKQDLRTSHIPVILLTAKNSADDRVECYNAGADAYISKPFDLKVLDARIKNFIANKQLKQKEFQEDKDINLSKLENQMIDDKWLKKAIKIIEENLLDVDFDVIAFAEALNMSKSSLYRKLKAITGLSPNEFIRNIRLKAACQRLKDDRTLSVSEVAYAVGFSDPKYFSTCFKNEFHILPSQYQRLN